MELIKKKVRYDTKPNITSLLFLLKNKAPNEWQDRRSIEVTTDDSRLQENIDFLKTIVKGGTENDDDIPSNSKEE